MGQNQEPIFWKNMQQKLRNDKVKVRLLGWYLEKCKYQPKQIIINYFATSAPAYQNFLRF